MTDTKKLPEALRIAGILRVTGPRHMTSKWVGDAFLELERQHAEIADLHAQLETLRAGYDAARLEIASLQAQLESVGGGGVVAMMPKHTHPQAKEREAYIAYLTTTFPNTYSEDDAQRWWAQEHISALAWDARSALAQPQPQQIAEPASQFDAGYFYNLTMHTLMDVGAPGCKYRLECMADELRVLMQATPKEPS